MFYQLENTVHSWKNMDYYPTKIKYDRVTILVLPGIKVVKVKRIHHSVVCKLCTKTGLNVLFAKDKLGLFIRQFLEKSWQSASFECVRVSVCVCGMWNSAPKKSLQFSYVVSRLTVRKLNFCCHLLSVIAKFCTTTLIYFCQNAIKLTFCQICLDWITDGSGRPRARRARLYSN